MSSARLKPAAGARRASHLHAIFHGDAARIGFTFTCLLVALIAAIIALGRDRRMLIGFSLFAHRRGAPMCPRIARTVIREFHQ